MKTTIVFLLMASALHAPNLAEGLLTRTLRSPLRQKEANGNNPLAPHNPAAFSRQGFHQNNNHDMRRFMTSTETVGETVRNVAGAFIARPDKVVTYCRNLAQVLHWQGMSFFFITGWFLVPIMEKPYTKFQEARWNKHNKEKEEEEAETDHANHKPYQKSLFHGVVDLISQASKIAFSVYVVDALRIGLQALGYTNIPHLAIIPRAYMRVAYTFWLVDRLAAGKRHLVAKKAQISNPQQLPHKVQLVNRLVDIALYSMGFFAAVSAVKADLGAAAKGFVAIGSFSTLLVSLATQNIASQVVSGLFLDISNRIHRGEKVRIGGGNAGTNPSKIERLGWLNTEMRGADDVKVVVPNKVLVDKEVSNLSQAKISQVTQKLEFKYQDVQKLPALMDTIKEEIRKSCPRLITDGSRPFRAHFENFGSKLEVTVDAHFKIAPDSTAYWDNRQEVLLAITRAVEKHDVNFAQA